MEMVKNIIIIGLLIIIVGCIPDIKEKIMNPETKTIIKYINKTEKILIPQNIIKTSLTQEILEKCINKGSTISPPQKRELIKKTICSKNCDYKLYRVSIAESMIPLFDFTDRLTVYTNIKEEDIEICDIVGFKSPETPERLDWIIHQVVNINESGYQTKGINNYKVDDYIVQYRDILFKLIAIEYGSSLDYDYWENN